MTNKYKRKPGDFSLGFPTKEQKEFELKGWVQDDTSKYYYYWTTFDRRYPETWEIVRAQQRPLMPTEIETGWWEFKTNIEPFDFDRWPAGRARLFLKQMWEIYRYRKVEYVLSNSGYSVRSV